MEIDRETESIFSDVVDGVRHVKTSVFLEITAVSLYSNLNSQHFTIKHNTTFIQIGCETFKLLINGI